MEMRRLDPVALTIGDELQWLGRFHTAHAVEVRHYRYFD